MEQMTIDSLAIRFNSYMDMIKKNKIEDDVINKITFLEELFEWYCGQLKPKTRDFYQLNPMLLGNTVMDYYTDMVRIKEFHPIEFTNVYKRIGYMVYWFLKRKPIQIVSDSGDVEVDINERFMVSYIINEFLNAKGKKNPDVKWNECWSRIPDNRKNNFFDNWVYFLTYRGYTAQTLELALMNFEMGLNIEENIKPR